MGANSGRAVSASAGQSVLRQSILEQSERVLDGLQEAEEAELPKVCCCCAMLGKLSVCRSGNGT